MGHCLKDEEEYLNCMHLLLSIDFRPESLQVEDLWVGHSDGPEENLLEYFTLTQLA